MDLRVGDAYLFPDGAAFTGDGARPLSRAGTETIFPGCRAPRSAPTELAAAGPPSPRRPGDRLTLLLPLPLLSWLRLADLLRSGVLRRGEGLDTPPAPCLSQSSSSSAPPPQPVLLAHRRLTWIISELICEEVLVLSSDHL